MTKDRLKALQAVVQENGGSDEDSGSGVINTTIDIEDENFGYMEHYFRKTEQTRAWIREMSENIDNIKALHSQLLSSPRPDENIKAELESRSETVKQLGKRVNTILKDLEKSIQQEEEEVGPGGRHPAGLRIRRTQHAATLHLFIEAITQFNLEQVDYKEKCEERIQRVISIAKAVVTDEKLEELLEQGNYGTIFSGDIITETLEVRRALEDVQIRHQELLKLEKSIQELRDLFLEMAVLVEQQGELINRIENHVQEAGEHVEVAKIHTTKAIKYQDKARVKKIIIAVVVVLLIIAIIVTAIEWPKGV